MPRLQVESLPSFSLEFFNARALGRAGESQALVLGVEVVHWNPRQPRVAGRLGKLLPKGKRTNNFGDLLGPVIVDKIREERGLAEAPGSPVRRLLAVGSILRMAEEGDVIWGAGANGKTLELDFSFEQLDVRAVRGPLTREFLKKRGVAVPPVFGDPGLLVGHFWNRMELSAGFEPREFVTVPNFHDFRLEPTDTVALNPCAPLWDVIGQIAASEFVVGSSLHAIVVAESLGIPARLIRSGTEPAFKYEDYYLGSGRGSFQAATSVSQALELGGEPLPQWDSSALLSSFPSDLWRSPSAHR